MGVLLYKYQKTRCCILLREGLTREFSLPWKSLCDRGSPWTHNTAASAFLVLVCQERANMLSLAWIWHSRTSRESGMKPTCSLGLTVKLPTIGFMQATYWQPRISLSIIFCRSYLRDRKQNLKSKDKMTKQGAPSLWRVSSQTPYLYDRSAILTFLVLSRTSKS